MPELELMRPITALLPGDRELPYAKRLSVAVCEALGQRIRRRVIDWTKSRPGEPVVVFDILDEHWADRIGATDLDVRANAGSDSCGPDPRQRWIPLPHYATDLSHAEKLVEAALEAGYSFRRDSGWAVPGGQDATCHIARFWWMGSLQRGKSEPPPGWLGASDASSSSAAEAIAVAFLLLTGRASAKED